MRKMNIVNIEIISFSAFKKFGKIESEL
jgi:hypothetical protein